MSLVKKYARIEDAENYTVSVMMGNIEDENTQAMAQRWGYTLMELEKPNDTESYYLPGHVPEAVPLTYREQRQEAYPATVEQLDMLYHDIEQGKLGETAKDSSFYLALKQIKDTYAKQQEEPMEGEQADH